MTRAKSAISLGVTSLIVIALIIMVGLGVYLNSTFNSSSTTSSSMRLCQGLPCSTTTSTGNSGLYLLSFNQTSFCVPGSSLYGAYFYPWSVTLTSGSYEATIAQPPNSAGAPSGLTSTKNESYASISFSVLDGTYNYTINPTGDFENSQTYASSGTITINGNNATVYVRFNLASCGSTITTTTKTSSNTTTTTQTNILPAACSGSLALGGSLAPKANSSATLCVEYYYYGSQPKTFSRIGQLNITGFPSSGSMFDASSNFTVTSSVSNLTIGGPSNENEGSMVIYTITPKADSSGTYLLNLGWLAVGQAPNVLDCVMEFLLVSGNGNPSYTSLNSTCITMTSSGTLPYPYYAGTLFARVVGATNNTA